MTSMTNETKNCKNSDEIDSHFSLQNQPRLGLGSTESENIALRRNVRELELLTRKHKMLGIEQEHMMKIIDLNCKNIQVNYKRLTKRVSRIRPHLTEEEMREMENDQYKLEFANKYRQILRKQFTSTSDESDWVVNKNTEEGKDWDQGISEHATKEEQNTGTSTTHLQTISEDARENTLASYSGKKISVPDESRRRRTSQTCRAQSKGLFKANATRPETCPVFSKNDSQTEDDSLNEIIPSLEGLLDQLHNIKPQQFYENQRKLKLYDLQFLCEELETRKQALFREVDAIINWDKKKEDEEQQEEAVVEKPRKRKTTFMRSILRNFSRELMMKTVQYGWTDLSQCRYLRTRDGNNEGATSGVNTLAKDTMKIKLTHDDDDSQDEEKPSQKEERVTNLNAPQPPVDENGRLIRTADLLGIQNET